MKTFIQWIEAISAPNMSNYDDIRIDKSEKTVLDRVKAVLSHLNTVKYEILGHGIRSVADLPEIYKNGLSFPVGRAENPVPHIDGFMGTTRTIFEAGIPIEKQENKHFDGLLQWSYAHRKQILLIQAPPNDPLSIVIKNPKERTAMQWRWSPYVIDPKSMLGYFDAEQIKFFPK